MINTSSAERTTITIQGQQFSVPAPFLEGHVLRPNEAAVLNQTYAENIRNNFAGAVKKAAEEGKDVAALQSDLDKYVSEYDFGIRRIGVSVSVDPVEREAMALATKKVRDALKKKGINVKDLSKEKLAEMAKGALDKYPVIREQAAKIVAMKKEVGSSALSVEV